MGIYQQEKHDIGIVRTDGTTTVGFMLVRDKNDVPIYEVIDDDFLADQQLTGVPGYSGLPPEKELALINDDHRAGFGLEVYDTSDPKRYYYTITGDARTMRTIKLGPLATTITKPSHSLTISNADMELAATGWTNGARDATYAQGGSYSWLVGFGVTVTQALTGYKLGVTYTFTCYVRDNGVNHGTARLGLYDGVTTTLGTNTTTTGSWVQRTVTYRIPLAGTATTLQLQLLNTSGSEDVWFDTAAITADITVGVSKCGANFADNYYRSFGSLLAKLNTGTGASFDLVADLGSTITALEPFADGNLYIGLENTTVIENCEDAWNEQVVGSVTASADTTDYKVGSGSAKFVVTAGFTTGVIGSEAITSTNLAQRTGIKCWVKSSVALNANDWILLLDNNANCASPTESLNLPALTANVWTRVFLKLANPASDTAIISIGLEQNVDKGAMSFWIDDVEAEDQYCYMTGTEVFTQSTLTNGFAKFFKTVNGTSPTLWLAETPNILRSATDPTNAGSWSNATYVDSPYNDITGLVTSANVLYIAKEDRPFYLDSTGAVQVLVDGTQHLVSSSGGKNSLAWQENVYLPYGTQSLVEYDAGVITWLDPANYQTNLTDFDGQVQALASDEEWLYAALDNDTKIELMAARYEEVDGSTKWRWHTLMELTLAGCEHMQVSNIYQKRLYITSTDSSQSIYFIILDKTALTYLTGGYLVTPWLHANFKADSKAFIKLTLYMSGTTANIYFEAHYQKEGDSSWTDIGDFKTSPSTSAFIPVDGSSNKPVSTAIRFKFVGITNVTTTSPLLLKYDCRGRLYPPKRRIIQCAVVGSDAILNKQGELDDISAAHIETVLTEAENATWPVTFYDPWYSQTAVAKTVAFLPSREKMVKSEKEPYNFERVYYLQLQEIATS